MKSKRKVWLKIGGSLLAILAIYLMLLCFPQPFFAYSATSGELTLYSDRPFEPERGKESLVAAQAKLAASPLFSAEESHAIFICNARWRQMLFFNRVYGVGGVNYYPVTRNVFLRDALVEENRLVSPSGKLVPGDRTLDYFITHEIAHSLTGEAVGAIRYHLLPEWVREGYADYVGKNSTFNYDEALRAFLSDAPEMDREKSGLYLRYHLLVAYLLEKKKWSVQKLLEGSADQQTVENEVRTSAQP